jgi:hypothetical protein
LLEKISQKKIQCGVYKGVKKIWGKKNAPKSPYFEEKRSEIAIFRQ